MHIAFGYFGQAKVLHGSKLHTTIEKHGSFVNSLSLLSFSIDS